MARAAGLAWMIDDPRFATSAARLDNVAALEAAIETWTRTQTAEQVEQIMADAEIPCAKVSEAGDLFDHPQVRHRGQIIDVAHPTAGSVPMQGFVANLTETAAELRYPPPLVGAHTAEVLRDWLDYGDDRVQALADGNVV
jgi:crotonobetainyl-CoA:carnitine CoA-transferase CaiB-like acyl-CoA transferase